MRESMACLVGVWFVIGRLSRCSTCHAPVRTILGQMFVESVLVCSGCYCGTYILCSDAVAVDQRGKSRVVVRMNKINLTKTPCRGVSGGTIPPTG
jgi:hypothetical protein